jgi:4-hydroxy-tetrahydrodipicolinate synthase
MPAITTPFKRDLSVDYPFLRKHCRWLVDNGCTGIVTPGSLAEGGALTFEEKSKVWENAVNAVGERVPVIAAVSSLTTAEAVSLAIEAAQKGCRGLMVLPPYVYRGDRREMTAHVSAVFKATRLPCMLYNNPVAYGTDFVPPQIYELAFRHRNLAAVKESSTDVRRITELRTLLGDRLALFVGVDDAIVEGIRAGAVGWIAGLANALPQESVALFDAACRGDERQTFEIYKWFLPLLRMDTVPKFVQLIKLVQQEIRMGTARVRPPRMELSGVELTQALRVIRSALKYRPTL